MSKLCYSNPSDEFYTLTKDDRRRFMGLWFFSNKCLISVNLKKKDFSFGANTTVHCCLSLDGHKTLYHYYINNVRTVWAFGKMTKR